MAHVLELHLPFQLADARLERLDVLGVLGPFRLRVGPVLAGQESQRGLGRPELVEGLAVLLLQLLLLLGRLPHLLSSHQKPVSYTKVRGGMVLGGNYPKDMIQAGHLLFQLGHFALGLLTLALHRAQRATQRPAFRLELQA